MSINRRDQIKEVVQIMESGKERSGKQNEKIIELLRNSTFFKDAGITKKDNVSDLAAALKYQHVP